MTGGAPPPTDAITLDFELHHPPAKVWRALTDPDLVGRWLLPAIGFRLEPGASFTLQAPPQPEWDGVVSCHMLTVDPERELSYRWVVGELDTVVKFTITPVPAGTHLGVVHSGFRADQRRNSGGARYGWKMMSTRLLQLLQTMP